ncbi:hypothetical protein AK812_SmicGene21985 [Symbiodinium microadriaticum]|uniref:Uncharacterized protein n=1 Tax=Symbiodinium microadriaticum TaxID=2951 RepID=A0A1Q9DKX9_SYMMI|nr:hypothetical protein AK812_SmicGene21985 [Symbiodinium microadriaticum]
MAVLRWGPRLSHYTGASYLLVEDEDEVKGFSCPVAGRTEDLPGDLFLYQEVKDEVKGFSFPLEGRREDQTSIVKEEEEDEEEEEEEEEGVKEMPGDLFRYLEVKELSFFS